MLTTWTERGILSNWRCRSICYTDPLKRRIKCPFPYKQTWSEGNEKRKDKQKTDTESQADWFNSCFYISMNPYRYTSNLIASCRDCSWYKRLRLERNPKNPQVKTCLSLARQDVVIQCHPLLLWVYKFPLTWRQNFSYFSSWFRFERNLQQNRRHFCFVTTSTPAVTFKSLSRSSHNEEFFFFPLLLQQQKKLLWEQHPLTLLLSWWDENSCSLICLTL